MPLQDNFDTFIFIYCAHISIILLTRWSHYYSFTSLDNLGDGRRYKVLGIVSIPQLNQRIYIICGVLFLLMLIFTAIQILSSVTAFAASLLFFPFFAQIRKLSEIRRKADTIPLVLMTIAMSSWSIDHFWVNPVFLIKVILAQTYFAAGVQKLRNSGISWMNGKVLQAYLMEYSLWGDMSRAKAIAEKGWVCFLISTFTLTFELTFPIILFFPELEIIYVSLGILFHIGTSVVMQIHYLMYLGPVYWIFLVDLIAGVLR